RRKREGAKRSTRKGVNTPVLWLSQPPVLNNRAARKTRQTHVSRMDFMRYEFLVETYETERIKVVSVWSEFRYRDLPIRPRESDPRGRSVHEQMVHQCVSENLWFINMLGIDVGAPPLPVTETRLEFMKRYAEDSGKRR